MTRNRPDFVVPRGSRLWVLLLPILVLALVLVSGCGGRKRLPPRDDPSWSAGASGSGAAALPMPEILRIGLAAGAPAAAVRAEGAARLLGPDGAALASVAAGETVHTAPDPAGLAWRCGGRRGTSAGPLRLRPRDPGQALTWDGDPFAGEILIRVDRAGLTVVNLVALETYLRGVVPWELGRPGKAALAALAAQAVAARTYSVSHLGEREAFGFDMWADTRDQVYRGLYGTDPWCDRAIADSRGLVLRHGGREIEAYYCSTCGGVTSDVDAVWPREARPYLRSRPDTDGAGRAWCRDSRHFAWEAAWTAQELEATLAKTLPAFLAWLAESPARQLWSGTAFRSRGGADPSRPGRLRAIAVESRTPSGRVARLRLETDAGTWWVRGDRVRWVLKPADGSTTILRSALFDIETTVDADGRPARIVARGHGFGHGVGLCQTGALGMARAGRTMEQILAHYYPGARLASVDEGR